MGYSQNLDDIHGIWWYTNGIFMKYSWVPSGNQTWLGGKSPSSMIFLAKNLPLTVDFPIAMVDFQKVNIRTTLSGIVLSKCPNSQFIPTSPSSLELQWQWFNGIRTFFIPNMEQSPATLWTSPNSHVSKNCGAHLYSLYSQIPPKISW